MRPRNLSLARPRAALALLGAVLFAVLMSITLVAGPASAAVTYPTVPTGTVNEDEPGWDCRVDGDTLCGVNLEGTRYIVDFNNGAPYRMYVASPQPPASQNGYNPPGDCRTANLKICQFQAGEGGISGPAPVYGNRGRYQTTFNTPTAPVRPSYLGRV